MSITELPVVPFDGMNFIDAWRRKWEYSSETGTWLFKGYLPKIPLADENTIGLLSSNLKTLLDSIPEKAGGFGILTKFSFGKVIGDGLNGLMTGNIILKSNTLDIKCRDQNGKLITKTCNNVVSSPEANLIPSIDINFGSDFLDTLCIEVPGGAGPKGLKGLTGPDGEDGFGDGPQGLQGDPGKDATGISEVSGITIEIDDSFYDTAVVNVELDQINSILSVTKAKLAVPDDSTPADKLIVMPIIRTLEFGDGTNYTIIAPAGENLGLPGDVGILAYPTDFDPEEQNSDVEMSRKSLSSFIDKIITKYQILYDKYIIEYDKEIKDFIYSKDDEARKVLDTLVAQLAAKQFSETFEYCMGLADNGVCGQQMLKAMNELVVSVQSIERLLAIIASNTTPSGDVTAEPASIYDLNSLNSIQSEISNVISTKTSFVNFAISSQSTYTSDICNYAPQILEASGEITYNDVCPDIQSQSLGNIEVIPGHKYNIKNGIGGTELPSGAYIVQYTGGAVYDSSQQDCGYVVGSGGVTRGLVLNIETGGIIKKIPMPMSSQISDPHDKTQVINSYLTGPITEMAIGSFASDGDKMWLEVIVGDNQHASGSINVAVRYCARCAQ